MKFRAMLCAAAVALLFGGCTNHPTMPVVNEPTAYDLTYFEFYAVACDSAYEDFYLERFDGEAELVLKPGDLFGLDFDLVLIWSDSTADQLVGQLYGETYMELGTLYLWANTGWSNNSFLADLGYVPQGDTLEAYHEFAGCNPGYVWQARYRVIWTKQEGK